MSSYLNHASTGIVLIKTKQQNQQHEHSNSKQLQRSASRQHDGQAFGQRSW
jgi:hypothetical protein